MKGIILLGIYCLFSVAARSQEQMVVDPNASVRNLPCSFNRIKISSAFKVIINQSETESIAVSASEEKFKKGIKTEIVNGTLKIFFDGGNNWNGKDRNLKAYISFKDISHLDVSGACDVAVVGTLILKEMIMDIAGASTFKGNVSVDYMELKMTGASKATFSGSSGAFNIDCSGATDLDAYRLTALKCNASASGASDIDIYVENELNATASGASNIQYKGSPPVANVKKSPASSILKID